MKNILLLLVGLTLISCEEDLIQNYQFEMNGRTYQDNNGYYHLTIDPIENQQTIHRFGAHITNVDIWGIPTQVIWNCDAVWSYELFTNNMNVPIVNGTSFADPIIDSVYLNGLLFSVIQLMILSLACNSNSCLFCLVFNII